jgi:two-component system response regulator DctR
MLPSSVAFPDFAMFAPSDSPVRATHTLNIGIIEDNRMTQVLLQKYLESKGHRVVGCAADYEDALLLAEHGRPDLVFLDVQLLTTSGFEVLRELKKNYPSIIVVMLSGSATPALMRAALERGAFTYVTKPFDYDTLDQVVEDAYAMSLPLAA